MTNYAKNHASTIYQSLSWSRRKWHRTQRMRITSSVTQDGARVLVGNYSSFYSCWTTSYALFKFLDVYRVNVFAIYSVCCILIELFLPHFKLNGRGIISAVCYEHNLQKQAKLLTVIPWFYMRAGSVVNHWMHRLFSGTIYISVTFAYASNITNNSKHIV